ncbi:MAG: O-antigen ligase family protein [Pyrinomonadaceae bacterium]|nr:O-antigen ligase family protein [Pyrinomonadaceae bacterium]
MFLRIAKFSLCLLVFSLCYIQPFVSLFNFQIPPTEFIFLLTAAFWLLSIFTEQTKFRFHRFYWLLLFYFAAMLISAVLSDDWRTSFIKLGGELYLLSLPVLIFNLVESAEELKRLIQIWLFGTALAVLFGVFIVLLFYWHREHWLLDYTVYSFGAVPVGNYPRLRLNFLTPSLLCNYLSVSFSLLLIAASLNWVRKSVLLIFSSLILLIAAFTISSGLGGFALVIGWWIFFSYRDERKLFAVFSLSGGILIAFLFWAMNFVALQPHSTAPFSFSFFGFEFYPSPRVMIWQASLQTFRENLFFGRGVGQDSCQVVFQNTDGGFSTLTDAHNVFLSVASQAGCFGLLAIVLIIFYLLKQNLAADFSRDKSSVLPFGLWIAFVSAFVYQGLVGSFEDARHLWVLIGLMLCANDWRNAGKGFSPSL